MLEIKLIRLGECYFEAGQFNRYLGDEHRLFMTDDILEAQLWQGEEDIDIEEVAKFIGGEVVTLQEVTDDEQ